MTIVRPAATIEFVGLRAQYAALKTEIDAAIAAVVSRSAFIGGSELIEFERWFADYCGVSHALGVASGTAALELVLRALGVGPGAEVVTAVNTFIATAAAISATGARPVFVDVDEAGNIDPNSLRQAISSRTNAIVPVHLYGRPTAMREIADIAGAIPVVEDAAQAHGAKFQNVRIGALGAAGCFSFYPTKNLGAFGDGGLVTTNDDRLASTLSLLRDHGRSGKYDHAIVGFTARLDNLQAAVLRVQANRLEEWNARRRQVADWYREALQTPVVCPEPDLPGCKSVYHLFVVRAPRRDALRSHLGQRGIATAVHYPTPLHLQPAYAQLGYRRGDFPMAERLAGEIVSLPMHPFLSQADVQYVADAVADFYRLA